MAKGSKYDIEKLRKIFIGGLDPSTKDEEFKDYFSKFGDIKDSVVIKDPVSKQSRGFGFVTYSSADIVDEVLKSRPHKIGKKEVEVKRAIPRDDESAAAHERTKKVFIGGLPKDTKEEEIKEFFESPEIGVVIHHIEMIKDKNTKEFRGFGFMTLENEDMADKLSSIRYFEGKKAAKNWEVKKAEPKGGEDKTGKIKRGTGNDRRYGDGYGQSGFHGPGGGWGPDEHPGGGHGPGYGSGPGFDGPYRGPGPYHGGGGGYVNDPFYDSGYDRRDDYRGEGYQQWDPRNDEFGWGGNGYEYSGQGYGRFDDYGPRYPSRGGHSGSGRYRPY